MTEKWERWDAAADINTQEDVIEFMNAVLELDDPSLFSEALGIVARSQGMTSLAREVGVGRESLYRSLSRSGNPRFSTVAKVLDTMGLEFQVAPKATATA